MENNSIDLNNFDIDEIKNDEELRESAIRYFDSIINEEMKKKSEEQNMDLIDDCIRQIALLKGVKAEFTEDELAEKAQQAINAVKAKMAAKKRSKFKSLIAAAAAVALLSGTFVGASAFSPQFKDWVLQLLDMPLGETVGDENVTLIHGGEHKSFNNITELMNTLNIDVLYPTVLPKDIYIVRVNYTPENSRIYFEFNDNKYNYSIIINEINPINEELYPDIYTNNGLTMYIKELHNKTMTATFLDDSNTYIFVMPDKDSLILVFDGLRRIDS